LASGLHIMGRLGKQVGARLSSPASRVGAPVAPVVLSGPRRSRSWTTTPRWKALRLQILARDRWICQATGVVCVDGKHERNAAVVDHIMPHRGDPRMFWDPRNLQTLAKWYHDSVKQSLEKRGLADVPEAFPHRGGGSIPGAARGA
jgi:hypothetical protein